MCVHVCACMCACMRLCVFMRVCVCMHACVCSDVEKAVEFEKFLKALKTIYTTPAPGEDPVAPAGSYIHSMVCAYSHWTDRSGLVWFSIAESWCSGVGAWLCYCKAMANCRGYIHTYVCMNTQESVSACVCVCSQMVCQLASLAVPCHMNQCLFQW